MLPVASLPFCSTTPSWRRTALISSVSIALPSRNTAPDSGFSKPSSNRNSEDLPLPDGPTMATYSPGAILKRDVVEHRRTARHVAKGHARQLDRSRQFSRRFAIVRNLGVARNQRPQAGEVRDGDQRFADARGPRADRCPSIVRTRRRRRESRRHPATACSSECRPPRR